MTTEKPTLKLNTKTIHEVDYRDLEEFVRKVYNCPDYEFVEVQEASNNTSYTFNPMAKNTYDWWEKDFKEIRSGKIKAHMNSILFQCLVEDGFLEAGSYLVNVYW